MSSFKVFDIAGSGMSAESVRLNTVASNLANADSVSGDPTPGLPGQAPGVPERAGAGGSGPRYDGARHGNDGHRASHLSQQASASVKVSGIASNTAAPEARYDPSNPLANSDGYVYSSNVNVVEEMTDMISASRSYQNNVEVMNTARNMMLDTLKLGQS
jgi:flagellar basal-body rod protein FlgC